MAGIGTNVYWSLFNRSRHVQIDGLTFSQVSLLAYTFRQEQFDDWLAWHEEATEWHPLIEYRNTLDPLAYDYLFREHPQPPRKIKLPVTESNAVETIEYVESKRLAKRFRRKFSVFIRANGKIIQTETIDISLSGLQVRQPLPENFGKVEMTLVPRQGLSLELIGEVIDDEKRNRLKIVRVSNIGTLRDWLTGRGEA